MNEKPREIIFDLHCPYCGELFRDVPKGKKRCSNCNNVVYLKLRWGETQKQLVKRSEAVEIEADWKVKIAERLALDAQVTEQLKRDYEQQAQSVDEVPDIGPDDIGILWWNSRDDQVCDKCLEMTGRWFPNGEAFRVAKQIHPDGSCRCVKHFDVGTPAEALVGREKVKQKMRPMTEADRAEYDSFIREHYDMTYDEFLQKVISGLFGRSPREK